MATSDDACSASASAVWSTPLLLFNIVRFMDPNDIACCVRLTNQAAAALFLGSEHTTIHVSQACLPDEFRRHWGTADAVRGMNIKQRQRLVCLTVMSGVLANLVVAFKAAGCAPTPEMMEAAATSGKTESCDWLHQRGCPWGKALVAAGRAGHWRMFDHLLSIGCPCTTEDAYAALSGGHTRFLIWLELRRPGVLEAPQFRVEKLVAAAARGCDLGTFQRFHTEWLAGASGGGGGSGPAATGGTATADGATLAGGGGPAGGICGLLRRQHQLQRDSQREVILAAAASSPTPDWRAKVEWLEGLLPGYPRGRSVAVEAASCPDGVERLAWLQLRGYTVDRHRFEPATLQAAGREGNIPLMEHLLKELILYHFAKDAAEAAAGAGHLGFLQALYRVTELTADDGRLIAVHAARNGNLPIVAWAVEQLGLDIGEVVNDLLPAAAESGSLELLDWIWGRCQARPWQALEGAARGGCRLALEWLADHGFVEAEATPDAAKAIYFAAAQNGDLDTLHWLNLRLPGEVPEGLLGLLARSPRCCAPLTVDWLVDRGGCVVEPGCEGLGLGAASPGGIHAWLAQNASLLSVCSTGLTSHASLEHGNGQNPNAPGQQGAGP